ncbi:MAG TPA: hypothetical protein VN703_09870 [Candidatus Sulfopaludibacter sp.]|nr:hypothetical protein [Candidatus Sulfopaludibacter sp.]
MSAVEVYNSCRVLLLKINIITGFNLPDNEFKDILIEQICKKMVESYPTVNIDEVEYAFRNKDLSIKDWGKNFNVGIFDEVMIPYLEKRYDISKIEESIKTKPIQVENKRELTYWEMENWVEQTKLVVKDISKVFFIPEEIYEWLTKSGKLNVSKEEKIKSMEHAINLRVIQLTDFSTNGNVNDAKMLSKFIAMRQEGIFLDKEAENLIRIAKKISVFNYFNSIDNERTD